MAVVCLSWVILAFVNDKPAYRIYNAKGKESNYSEIIAAAEKADIVFFGEMHDNPICHWLELEITKDLYKKKKQDFILGAEMFESDNQLILDEYLTGKIKSQSFSEGASLWPNYKTDYKPIIEFAKENKIKFIASNVPRRYAAIVNSKGFGGLDSLTVDAKKYIAPLPIKYDPTVKCYKDMLEMGGMGMKTTDSIKKTYENLPKAQAIKDATMAYFILQNWSKGKQIFHFNGSYHSDFNEGILLYIKQQNSAIKTLTISAVAQSDIDSLSSDYRNQADFIICIPDDMTKTKF